MSIYCGLRVKYKNYTLMEFSDGTGKFRYYYHRIVFPNGEYSFTPEIMNLDNNSHTGRNLKKILKRYVDRLSPEQDKTNRLRVRPDTKR